MGGLGLNIVARYEACTSLSKCARALSLLLQHRLLPLFTWARLIRRWWPADYPLSLRCCLVDHQILLLRGGRRLWLPGLALLWWLGLPRHAGIAGRVRLGGSSCVGCRFLASSHNFHEKVFSRSLGLSNKIPCMNVCVSTTDEQLNFKKEREPWGAMSCLTRESMVAL